MLAQRLRRLSIIVKLLYKCFVFATWTVFTGTSLVSPPDVSRLLLSKVFVYLHWIKWIEYWLNPTHNKYDAVQ